ncbi:MAG: four helix bundle protein [Armatimonadota bacterium]
MKDESEPTPGGEQFTFKAVPERGRQDLRARTQQFALAVVRFYGQLPRTAEAQVLGRQLLRAGTSPGAQYREAFRAKSTADLISKMEGALQELEETHYWLELLQPQRSPLPRASRRCFESRMSSSPSLSPA